MHILKLVVLLFTTVTCISLYDNNCQILNYILDPMPYLFKGSNILNPLNIEAVIWPSHNNFTHYHTKLLVPHPPPVPKSYFNINITQQNYWWGTPEFLISHRCKASVCDIDYVPPITEEWYTTYNPFNSIGELLSTLKPHLTINLTRPYRHPNSLTFLCPFTITADRVEIWVRSLFWRIEATIQLGIFYKNGLSYETHELEARIPLAMSNGKQNAIFLITT